MAITGNKFEAYHSIIVNRTMYGAKEKNVEGETIIKIAKEEYDVNLTKKDLEEMRENWERYLNKYKLLI